MSTTTTEAETVIAEQRAVDRGWAVWRNAMHAMWPESIRRHVASETAGLRDALETHSLVLNEDIHPVEAFDGVTPGDWAYAEAIAMAVRNVTEWTGELLRVFPAAAPQDDQIEMPAVEAGAIGGMD